MDQWVFGREAMLMMIYANGEGVARNFDLALRFACEVDGSLAEMRGRIEHLQKLKREHWTGTDFDLCDDMTSGFLVGECVTRGEKFKAIERRRKLEHLTLSWKDGERTALQELQQAARQFFEERAENEVDLSGTGRTAAYVGELGSLNDGLVDALARFENGPLPRYSSAQFVSADAELNSVYVALRNEGDLNSGSITMAGIRRTELAWIKYRDPWVNFGRVKYPSVPAAAWKTWLTRERIKMLREIGY
jgi:hypothetical protein